MPHFLRAIDRVTIARQLAEIISNQMDYGDVSTFFKRLRVNGPSYDEDYSPSLKQYARGFLDECTDEQLLDVADQFGLHVDANASQSQPAGGLGESKYWLIDHLRVFISHVHTAAPSAGNLRATLQKYAISCFVAHADINVSDEWQEEILRALGSMDCLVAVLTPDFCESRWCDQEVGFGVARGVLIVPLNKGQIPYGFIQRFQASATGALNVGDVAEMVFKTIARSTKTRNRMIESLVKTIAAGSEVSTALFRLSKLQEIEGVATEDWERLRANVATNSALRSSLQFVEELNKILLVKDVAYMPYDEVKIVKAKDELPF